jgi:hypothetical protein
LAVGGYRSYTLTSIGIALSGVLGQGDSEDPPRRRTTMYRAKEGSRSLYGVFEGAM